MLTKEQLQDASDCSSEQCKNCGLRYTFHFADCVKHTSQTALELMEENEQQIKWNENHVKRIVELNDKNKQLKIEIAKRDEILQQAKEALEHGAEDLENCYARYTKNTIRMRELIDAIDKIGGSKDA